MTLVIRSVLPLKWPGFGPVTLLPFTMYSQEPSALNVMSCGSNGVGMSALTLFAFGPDSGMTAIEFDPLLTAYSVPPSGDSLTANVAAPVYFVLWTNPRGARASIFLVTAFAAVSITATWSALSCAT